MGISNLSNVRAHNLQELIYKNGQAGIKKASVTIIFDNTDNSNSPIGYETSSEITITRIISIDGRNKYLLNGSNSSSSRIHDLFCSVQMNVNNPHFLIMQGRITKVLNMKPFEILSMIEEATGTKMYENKRQLAIDSFAKKELKLNEIKGMLNDDITPVIDKLKRERSSYLEFQKLGRELEHNTRIVVAYDYCKVKELKIKQNDSLEHLNNDKKSLIERTTNMNEQVKCLDMEIEQIQQQAEKETGGVFATKQQELKDVSAREIKASTSYQYAVETFDDLNQKLVTISKNINKCTKTSDDNTILYHNLLQELNIARTLKQTKDTELEEAVSLLQSATIGIADSASKGQSITDLIIASSSRLSTLRSNLDSVQKQISAHNEQMQESSKKLQSTTHEFTVEEKQENDLECKIQLEKDTLTKLNFDMDSFNKQSTEKNECVEEIRVIRRDIEQFESKNPALVFNSNASLGSRSKVFGLLSSLFDVVDDRFNTAIESASGGKLFNVVVDTDETSKIIIKSGSLKKRITFIALNRVKPYTLHERVIENAQRIVGEQNVWRAIDLVEYEDELKPAIEFMLGGTLICSNSDTARKLVYDKSVGCRCVTLEGDVFESTGTLTGGSRPTNSSLLSKQKHLRDLKRKMEYCCRKERELGVVLKELESKSNDYYSLNKSIADKQHNLQLIKAKLKTSDRFQLEEKILQHKNELKEAKNLEMELRSRIEEETKSLAELEMKSNSEEGFKKEMLQKRENSVKQLKLEVVEISNKIVVTEKKVYDLELINEEMKNEVKLLLQQQTTNTQAISEQKIVVGKLEVEMKKIKETLTVIEGIVNEMKETMNKNNQKMRSLNHEKSTVNKAIFEVNLKIKEVTQEVKDVTHEIQHSSHRLQEMLVNSKWIESEEKYFNVSGNIYDFNNINMEDIKEKIGWLDKSIKKISRSVNTRAMNMLSQAEEKYNELIRKKKIVEEDRLKIEAVIIDLDKRKKEAVEMSSQKVNQDFSMIFATLLPGATAKLVSIFNNNVLEGLEIKVGFGNTWKESLSELSGGQRSLVALSLILALLSFKPAPIYILDEIDAALDLSHTQNIGQLLKIHFRKSQFIVVSLKDGMFSNATVLYRTKFINGVSTVTRHRQNENINQKENNSDGHNLPLISSS